MFAVCNPSACASSITGASPSSRATPSLPLRLTLGDDQPFLPLTVELRCEAKAARPGRAAETCR